jgi:hypothetical protein
MLGADDLIELFAGVLPGNENEVRNFSNGRVVSILIIPGVPPGEELVASISHP